MSDKDPRHASLTDNDFFPKVADRLRAEIDGGADRLDVVTGYIAPSAWAVLGEALEKVGDTRILLGKDYQLAPPTVSQVTVDTGALVREAIRAEGVPSGLPVQSDAKAIAAALTFLKREDVKVKVWTDGFLHAKAYILPLTAGVGSANFTAGGLVANRELVGWREDRAVVDELRSWFQRYWDHDAAAEYKAELIDALNRTTFGSHPYTPYDVLIRVLAARYGTERPPSLEAADFKLNWFQEDAVFRLIQMIEQPAHGALLADAVGLGKSYMALGVIHHYLYNTARGTGSGPPVLVITPASLQRMWEGLLRRYGLLWACNLVTIQSLDRDEDIAQYAGAGLVVVDEAHRLRSRGVWYQRVLDILTSGAPKKRVLLLTATPLSTGIRDLTALLQVLTKNRRNVWAPAIADFEAYLRRVEKGEVDPFPVLDRCIVRRSRTDILRDYEQRLASGMVGVERPKLPERVLAHATYEYAADREAELFDRFAGTLRSLRLAPYDLSPYRREAQLLEQLDAEGVPVHQPGSMAALVAAGLLKRFESSLEAIRLSLNRLEVVLFRCGEALDSSPPRLLNLTQSPQLRQLIDEERQGDDDREAEYTERWETVLQTLPVLEDPGAYDLELVKDAIRQDREAIAGLRAALPDVANDGKIAALRALFAAGGRLHKKRALVFSQFRDTAVYVHQCLDDPGWRKDAEVGPLALTHGGTGNEERAKIAATFDPDGGEEALVLGSDVRPQILVSTDVLAEGHNLQLAEAVVNFDLHWNPQVAVQRSGRVDRLNAPHAKVFLVSFVPEEGLDVHLGLIRALEGRFRLIHLLGLGDEPVTRLAADRQQLTLDRMRRLYADDVSVLDELERTWTLGSTDFMRAPLEAFLKNRARAQLEGIPLGVQSIKRMPAKDWPHGPGVFIAFQYEGESLWRFYPRVGSGWGDAVIDELALFRGIVCTEGEIRQPVKEQFPGPGGVIDWDLLVRAAHEVAEELTRRRATAALQRGASERSRRIRQQIRELGEVVSDVEGLDLLLDRLEEVRVEDYDHRPQSEGFKERIREARRADSAGQRRDLLIDVVRRGLELFGEPQGETPEDGAVVVPEALRLVAWELLVPPVAPGKQLTIAEQVGEFDLGDKL